MGSAAGCLTVFRRPSPPNVERIVLRTRFIQAFSKSCEALLQIDEPVPGSQAVGAQIVRDGRAPARHLGVQLRVLALELLDLPSHDRPAELALRALELGARRAEQLLDAVA